jgi:hypothetical protein
MARGKGSLRKAVDAVAQVREPDELDKKAARFLDEETQKDRSSTRRLREDYGRRVYQYLVGYSMAAFLLVMLHGMKYQGFQLDTTVISLIVGSTAVSAIGLVGIVVRGLFK